MSSLISKSFLIARRYCRVQYGGEKRIRWRKRFSIIAAAYAAIIIRCEGEMIR